MQPMIMTLEQIEGLAHRALTAAGTSDAIARALARATAGLRWRSKDPALTCA